MKKISKESDVENLMAAAIPGGIEMQEARGQKALCESTLLPKEIMVGTRKEFEDLGIKFGEEVDDLFVDATLPEGWKKEGTDHSMWSHIVDEKGKEIAAIFYKAAFYDRRAHMQLILKK